MYNTTCIPYMFRYTSCNPPRRGSNRRGDVPRPRRQTRPRSAKAACHGQPVVAGQICVRLSGRDLRVGLACDSWWDVALANIIVAASHGLAIARQQDRVEPSGSNVSVGLVCDK